MFSFGETTAGKEQQCTLHFQPSQLKTKSSQTSPWLKPPSGLVPSLTLFRSMHSLVHSHYSMFPPFSSDPLKFPIQQAFYAHYCPPVCSTSTSQDLFAIKFRLQLSDTICGMPPRGTSHPSRHDFIQSQCSLDHNVSRWQVSTWLWNAGEGGVWAWILSD